MTPQNNSTGSAWLRRWVPSATIAAGRDLPLEGLRGLCALLVFYSHVFLPSNALDPRWAPSARFWWFNLGFAAVLMFFVLSGYVIGLTTTRPATPAAMRSYLGRRALRLVPISTFAVLLSWALQPDAAGRTVLGNLLFLQNDLPGSHGTGFGLLDNNSNLWSLHYEVIYYLAFLALWRWSPRVGLVWIAVTAVAFARGAGVPMPEILARYACGALFWLGGLSVAWLLEPTAADDPRGHWPSALLAAHAMWQLGPLRSLFATMHLESLMWPAPVSPHRLDFLPVCLWVLLAVTGRAPRWERRLGWLCLGWCTACVAVYAARGMLVEFDYVGIVTLGAAWLTWRWRPDPRLLARLAPVGAVSFAFYAISSPLQIGQRQLLPNFSGSALTFGVRAIAALALTFGFAWLLEIKLQPWIKNLFRSTPASHFARETSPEPNSPR